MWSSPPQTPSWTAPINQQLEMAVNPSVNVRFQNHYLVVSSRLLSLYVKKRPSSTLVALRTLLACIALLLLLHLYLYARHSSSTTLRLSSFPIYHILTSAVAWPYRLQHHCRAESQGWLSPSEVVDLSLITALSWLLLQVTSLSRCCTSSTVRFIPAFRSSLLHLNNRQVSLGVRIFLRWQMWG